MNYYKIIEEIRKDEIVGEGTCSYVDECWGDDDIIQSLKEERIKTAEEAVAYFRWIEGLWKERENEIRNA